MQRIKKGDKVMVIAGRDLGSEGEVLKVLPRENRVIVDGVNIVSRHTKASQQGNQTVPAQIVKKNAPIDLSNVMLVCPSCEEASRIGYRMDGDNKVRFCKKCDSIID